MRELVAQLDALSYKKRGLKFGGEWFNTSDKIDFNELEKGAWYQVFVDENSNMIVELIRADKPQIERKTQRRSSSTQSYKAILQAHKEAIDTLNKRLAEIEEKLQKGNGYQRAFEVLVENYSKLEKRIDNLESWAVMTIQALNREVIRLKTEIAVLKAEKKEQGGKSE